MSSKHSDVRQLVAVAAVLGFGTLSIGTARPMLPLYLTDIGLEPSLLGLIISASMAGMVLGESLSGLVADRLGLRLPLVIGTVVAGLVVAGFAISKAVPFLFLVAFAWGTTSSAIFGPGRGYMATAAPPARKATYLAMINAIFSLSGAAGALPGGFIADNFGYDRVFYVSGALSVLGAIAVLAVKQPPTALPHPAPAPATRTGTGEWKASLPAFTVLGFIAAFIFLGMSIMWTFLPLFGTQVIGISATSVGIVFTVNGLAGAVFSVPMGMAADRMGKRRAMMLGLVACGLAAVGLVFARNLASLMALVVLTSFGMSTFISASLGVLSDIVPAERQATAMGLYGGICENTGLVVGSAAGGFIWQFGGPEATFLTAAAACATALVLCLVLGRLRGIRQVPRAGHAESGL